MKNLLIISFFCTLFSCSKHDDNPNNSFYLDESIKIKLENNNGENLLNTPSYNENDIKIFYKINGQLVEVFFPLLDRSKGFKIVNENNNNYMILDLNPTVTEALPETVIQWNELESDTIKVNYVRTENSSFWNLMWLNDVLKSNEELENIELGRLLKIVK